MLFLLLLFFCLDLDYIIQEKDQSMLITAALSGRASTVARLLEEKIDVNKSNSTGATALHAGYKIPIFSIHSVFLFLQLHNMGITQLPKCY